MLNAVVTCNPLSGRDCCTECPDQSAHRELNYVEQTVVACDLGAELLLGWNTRRDVVDPIGTGRPRGGPRFLINVNRVHMIGRNLSLQQSGVAGALARISLVS